MLIYFIYDLGIYAFRKDMSAKISGVVHILAYSLSIEAVAFSAWCQFFDLHVDSDCVQIKFTDFSQRRAPWLSG